jgi:hypothetical protein
MDVIDVSDARRKRAEDGKTKKRTPATFFHGNLKSGSRITPWNVKKWAEKCPRHDHTYIV